MRWSYVALVLACLVATAGCDASDHRGPEVPTPSSAATSPHVVSAAQVVERGVLTGYATDDHGDLMTVWTDCSRDDRHCRWAWRLATPGGPVLGAGRGLAPNVYGGRDAFVLRAWDRDGIVVGRDGHVRPLLNAQRGRVRAGDVLVRVGKGLEVADPGQALAWPLPVPPGTTGWEAGDVSADGTVWTTSLGGHPAVVQVGRLVGTRTWVQHPVSSGDAGRVPGLIAVAGDHVATFSTYDGMSVLGVGTFDVTDDGSRTWTQLGRAQLPFDAVDDLAATAGGTLYVASAGGEHLYRSTDDTWTRFALVRGGAGFEGLVPDGNRVLAENRTAKRPRLVAFDDRGRATPVSLL